MPLTLFRPMKMMNCIQTGLPETDKKLRYHGIAQNSPQRYFRMLLLIGHYLFLHLLSCLVQTENSKYTNQKYPSLELHSWMPEPLFSALRQIEYYNAAPVKEVIYIHAG